MSPRDTMTTLLSSAPDVLFLSCANIAFSSRIRRRLETGGDDDPLKTGRFVFDSHSILSLELARKQSDETTPHLVSSNQRVARSVTIDHHLIPKQTVFQRHNRTGSARSSWTKPVIQRNVAASMVELRSKGSIRPLSL